MTRLRIGLQPIVLQSGPFFASPGVGELFPDVVGEVFSELAFGADFSTAFAAVTLAPSSAGLFDVGESSLVSFFDERGGQKERLSTVLWLWGRRCCQASMLVQRASHCPLEQRLDL